MNRHTKEQILKLIAEDELQEAITLLQEATPEDNRDEAILHSARFADLQRHIRLGLVDYERQNVTKSQIRYGILQTIKAIEGEQPLSVLVAGTGQYQLADRLYWLAKSVGQLLGTQGYNLVCGGWNGVDYVVAEEFSKSILPKGLALSEHLVQVVIENSTPSFRGGDVLFVKQGIREWLEAIKYSDVVILIGGEGGTYGTYIHAHQEGRPVIPLPSAGGDAARVFEEILLRWEYWGAGALKGISKQEFEVLNVPIASEADAHKQALHAFALIKKLTKLKY